MTAPGSSFPAGGAHMMSPADVGTPTRTHGSRGGSGERRGPMDDADIQSALHLMVSDAILYTDQELSPKRGFAADRYNGRAFGDEEDGRSKFIMTVTRDTVNRMMPSLMKMFFGGERAMEYGPRRKEQIALADQVTEWVYDIVLQEDNQGFTIFYNWFKDALVKTLGIVTWWWDESNDVRDYDGTMLDAEQVALLRDDDEVEITKLTLSEGAPPGVAMYDAEYTRTRAEGRLRVDCIPPEEWLFTRGARRTEADDPLSGTALFVGRRTELTRGQLRSMGVSEEDIDEYAFRDASLQHNVEEIARQAIVKPEVQDVGPEVTRKALYIEGYPYLDLKGTGVAQLCYVRMLGPTYKVIGDPEPVDERPFAVLCPDPEPHTIVGQSVADYTMDLDRAETDIVRAVFDSLALTLNPRTTFVEGQVSVEDIMNTDVGAPIRQQAPGMVEEFVHKFVGAEALAVLEKLEGVLTNRVGVNSSTAELDPSALQSTTALAISATVAANQQKLELICRIFAETGITQLYKGLLREIVRHPQRKRMVRVRGTYVEMDPRSWDADLDVRVNVPLGAGMKSEKLGFIEKAIAKQELIMSHLGPKNPICDLKRYRDTLVLAGRISGSPYAEQFFGDVPPDYEPPPPPPSAEDQRAQADAELSKQKGQAELMRAQSEVKKREADVELDKRRLAMEEAKHAGQLTVERESMHLKDDRERDLHAAKLRLEHDEALLKIAQERENAARASAVEVDLGTTKLAQEHVLGQQKLEHEKELARAEADADKQIAALRVEQERIKTDGLRESAKREAAERSEPEKKGEPKRDGAKTVRVVIAHEKGPANG